MEGDILSELFESSPRERGGVSSNGSFDKIDKKLDSTISLLEHIADVLDDVAANSKIQNKDIEAVSTGVASLVREGRRSSGTLSSQLENISRNTKAGQTSENQTNRTEPRKNADRPRDERGRFISYKAAAERNAANKTNNPNRQQERKDKAIIDTVRKMDSDQEKRDNVIADAITKSDKRREKAERKSKETGSAALMRQSRENGSIKQNPFEKDSKGFFDKIKDSFSGMKDRFKSGIDNENLKDAAGYGAGGPMYGVYKEMSGLLGSFKKEKDYDKDEEKKSGLGRDEKGRFTSDESQKKKYEKPIKQEKPIATPEDKENLEVQHEGLNLAIREAKKEEKRHKEIKEAIKHVGKKGLLDSLLGKGKNKVSVGGNSSLDKGKNKGKGRNRVDVDVDNKNKGKAKGIGKAGKAGKLGKGGKGLLGKLGGLGEAAGKAGGAASKAGGAVLGSLGALGKGALKAVPLLGAALAAYDGFQGWNDKNLHKKAFGLKDGQEATTGQKASSAVASVLDMGGLLTGAASLLGFDIDTADIAKQIYDIGNTVGDVVKSVWGGIDGLFKEIGVDVGGIATTVSTAVSVAWNGVKDFCSNAGTEVSNIASNISTGVTNAWNGVKDFCSEASTSVSSTVSAVSTAVSDTWKGVETFFSDTAKNATDIASSVGDSIKGAWDKATSFFSDAAKGAMKLGGDIVDGAADGLKGAWNWLTGGDEKEENPAPVAEKTEPTGQPQTAPTAQSEPKKKKILGLTQEVPNESKDEILADVGIDPEGLATGGYADKPTLTWVGEGKEGEAIMPGSMLREVVTNAEAKGANSAGGANILSVSPQGTSSSQSSVTNGFMHDTTSSLDDVAKSTDNIDKFLDRELSSVVDDENMMMGSILSNGFDSMGNRLKNLNIGGGYSNSGGGNYNTQNYSNLPNAGLPTGTGLGALSANFESNGNSGAIGWDKVGGTSYGKYQIAAKTGTMDTFLKWAEKNGGANGAEVARRMRAAGSLETGGKGGMAPEEWKKLVAEGKMGDLEHQFIKATHFDPTMAGLSPELQKMVSGSKALQDVVWSTSVALGAGGAKNGLNSIYKQGMSEEDFIKAVYAYRDTRYGNSTEQVRRSVQNRDRKEAAMALNMLALERGKPVTGPLPQGYSNAGGSQIRISPTGGNVSASVASGPSPSLGNRSLNAKGNSGNGVWDTFKQYEGSHYGMYSVGKNRYRYDQTLYQDENGMWRNKKNMYDCTQFVALMRANMGDYSLMSRGKNGTGTAMGSAQMLQSLQERARRGEVTEIFDTAQAMPGDVIIFEGHAAMVAQDENGTMRVIESTGDESGTKRGQAGTGVNSSRKTVAEYVSRYKSRGIHIFRLPGGNNLAQKATIPAEPVNGAEAENKLKITPAPEQSQQNSPSSPVTASSPSNTAPAVKTAAIGSNASSTSTPNPVSIGSASNSSTGTVQRSQMSASVTPVSEINPAGHGNSSTDTSKMEGLLQKIANNTEEQTKLSKKAPSDNDQHPTIPMDFDTRSAVELSQA